MLNRQTITLDVSKIPYNKSIIRLGRKDKDGTILAVQILDHGQPLDVSEYDVSLLIKFSESEMYEFAGAVDGSEAVFIIDASTMRNAVTDNAYVSINGGSFVLSTARIRIEVLESAERS